MQYETKKRSVLKAISWRTWATVTTAVLVFIFTGKFALAITIGLLEVFERPHEITCLEEAATVTSAEDGEDPSSGEGFFYLVRAGNDCPGQGTVAPDSAGSPRSTSPCPAGR